MIDASPISSFPIFGIALAVLSAALLTVGNLLQSLGVDRSTRDQSPDDRSTRDQSPGRSSGLGASRAWNLLRQPIWLAGSALFGLAILVQLAALAFAPLIVVQPVGVVALVFASLLTAILAKRAPARAEVGAIFVCVVSLGVFVTVAAAVSVQTKIGDAQLIAILLVLLSVLIVTSVLLVIRRGRSIPPFFLVALAGLFAGFVATLGKTVILRVQTVLSTDDVRLDSTNLLTLSCLLGIAVAGGLSIWFVQVAHTVNAPQVVVAGLTVVDPFIAVILGITVLQEAAGAPLWSFAVFAVAGAAAMAGVWSLARTQKAPA